MNNPQFDQTLDPSATQGPRLIEPFLMVTGGASPSWVDSEKDFRPVHSLSADLGLETSLEDKRPDTVDWHPSDEPGVVESNSNPITATSPVVDGPAARVPDALGWHPSDSPHSSTTVDESVADENPVTPIDLTLVEAGAAILAGDVPASDDEDQSNPFDV